MSITLFLFMFGWKFVRLNLDELMTEFESQSLLYSSALCHKPLSFLVCASLFTLYAENKIGSRSSLSKSNFSGLFVLLLASPPQLQVFLVLQIEVLQAFRLFFQLL